MRRIMLVLSALSAAAPAAAAERRFTVTDFDRILVEGPFSVTLTTDKSPSAAASGTSEALERVAIDVQGRTLRIRPNRSALGGYPGTSAGPVKVAVSTHDLQQATVSGSGVLSIDRASAMKFQLAMAGSGRIALGKLEADNLVLGIAGSGAIMVGGAVKGLRATVQGSSALNGETLIVEDAQIDAETAGDIVVGVRRTAKITSAGTGNVEIVGSPACTVKATGSGLVYCGD